MLEAGHEVRSPGPSLTLGMTRLRTVLLFAMTLGCGPGDSAPTAIPNDNRVAAGTLRDGVLTLRLEARRARWAPDGDGGPSLVLPMFAQAGQQPQNPGPLIRVPAGTTIRVAVHNALDDSTVVVHGLGTRPSGPSDTLAVPPGATREREFVAGVPGTYFYWGSTTGRPIDTRSGMDSQLHGAFIVDSAGAPPTADRVFVLGSWTGPVDRAQGFSPDLRVINGRSWPHAERLEYTVGDTIRWRWVNPTDSPHPMHLHGFYFGVTHRGTWAADTGLAVGDVARVVTEMPVPGGTFAMTWIPEEPGNWLVHCHVAYHTSMFLAATLPAVPDDPVTVDHQHGMRGMVMAVSVRPGASTLRRATGAARPREIRLVAKAAPRRFQGDLDEMAFVSDDDALARGDSVPVPSSLLVLRRDEPVRVTIVNRLRAPTGVHWHGIEVPSYSDGVPAWSGSGNRLAPAIAPGDSFVAEFTPPRSGTFMYHAHSNENFQIGLGLYGGLLVVDSTTYDPARERLIMLGPTGPGERGARINGRADPDTLRLTAGQRYRLRIVHIVSDWTAWITLARGDSVVRWRALAKDGAELPGHRQTMGAAHFLAGPGETMDFEYQPHAAGVLQLRVRQRTGEWETRLPIKVEAPQSIE
jgi:manganese oxidase